MDAALAPLVDEAGRWAADRGLVLDGPLLARLLDLRLAHDGTGDAWWPAGTARHLMLVRLPQHGPVEAPSPDEVVSTLEAWWRWLRATGRMSAASALPSELVAEARRSRRGMERACERADAVERRIAWAEHRARLAGLDVPAPAGESAACFRDGDLAGQLVALVAACDGVLLDDGNLPAGLARALYDELGLGLLAATHDELSALLATDTDDEVLVAPEPLPWDESWAVADVAALDRLWWVALETGLVVVEEGRAVVGRPLPDDEDDEAWRALGVAAGVALARWSSWDTDPQALLMVLLQLDGVAAGGGRGDDEGPGPDEVPGVLGLDEVVERWLTEAAAVAREAHEPVDRELLAGAAAQVVAAVACFDDAGAWRRDGSLLWPTAFGHDVARALVHGAPTPPVQPSAGGPQG